MLKLQRICNQIWLPLWLVSQGDYLFRVNGQWWWEPNPLFEDWTSPWSQRLLEEYCSFGGQVDD